MNMNRNLLVNLIIEFFDPGQMFKIVYYGTAIVFLLVASRQSFVKQTNIVYLDTDFNLPCSFFVFPLSFWEVVELLLVCVRILREHVTFQTIFDCYAIFNMQKCFLCMKNLIHLFQFHV